MLFQRAFYLRLLVSAVALIVTCSATAAHAEGTTRVYVPLVQSLQTSTSGSPSGPSLPPPDLNAEELEVVRETNQVRAANNCPAVQVSAELVAAARAHSEDMAKNNLFSHTGSDGSDAGQRITKAGYTWTRWGENIVFGTNTGAEAMMAWENSKPHLANIVTCEFKEIGVARAYSASGSPYWTQVFASR